MNKKLMIPIGIVMIIIGIIAISYQGLEIQKSNDEIVIENKTVEDQMIDEKLNEIEIKASKNKFEPAPRDWQTSGPFQIDRSKYLIGEKIFIVIGGLESDEKGQIALLRPANETHYTVHQTIPFDGSQKNQFNYYTEARLSKQLGTCSIEDIVGEWRIVFRGTEYPNIDFEIINEILPGEEDSFSKPVC